MSGRQIMPASALKDRDAWLTARMAGIGSSEIASIMGLAPDYAQSPFDLFWTKVAGDDDFDEERLYWGRRLEAAVADRFAEEHPEFAVRRTGLWRSRGRWWQLATPDRLLSEGKGTSPLAVLEVKTDSSWEAWPHPDADDQADIPIHVRCQVQWQMDVVGVDVAYIAVLVMGRHYREFVVERDDLDLTLMRKRAEAFWINVETARSFPDRAADYAPDVDAHPSTGRRLRKLHPTMTDRAVEIPVWLVRQRQAARRLATLAQTRTELCDNRIRRLMGDARYATVDGDNVATRTVYDRKGFTMPPTTVNKLTVPPPKQPKKGIR